MFWWPGGWENPKMRQSKVPGQGGGKATVVSCAPLVPVPTVAASPWPCHGGTPLCQLHGDLGTRDRHHSRVTLAQPGPEEVAAPCAAPAPSSLPPGRGFKRLHSSANLILPNDAAVHLMRVIKPPCAPQKDEGRGEGNETEAEAGSCAALTPPEAPFGAFWRCHQLCHLARCHAAEPPGRGTRCPRAGTRREGTARAAPRGSSVLAISTAGCSGAFQAVPALPAAPGTPTRIRPQGLGLGEWGGAELCQERSTGPAPPLISRSCSPCRRAGRQRD